MSITLVFNKALKTPRKMVSLVLYLTLPSIAVSEITKNDRAFFFFFHLSLTMFTQLCQQEILIRAPVYSVSQAQNNIFVRKLK